MKTMFRRLTAVAAIVGAALLPQAQASTVIDFEGDALNGLYFVGDSFSQSGFRMDVLFDAATVDIATGLGSAAPSGSQGQFYTQSNDGELLITRADGGLFSLDGFSAAYVPINTQANPLTVIVALGTFADASTSGVAWDFGAATAGVFPFVTYTNSAGDFNGFKNLTSLEFFSCSDTAAGLCTVLTNDGTFALDNVLLTAAVPEPGTGVMLVAGLLGLLGLARRKARAAR